MTINCEHPTIIFNPNAEYAILRARRYHLAEGWHYLTDNEFIEAVKEFPRSYFSCIAYRLASSTHNGENTDMDDFYTVDDSGAMIPLFMLVPCRKCLICRNKLKLEWMFRAACENKYSTTVPLFVTLTYDNEHLPETGVQKRDVQLFLKRLRRNTERLFGSSEIRYFCAAEYGKNTKRPHYHLLLWNMPEFSNYFKLKDFINKAWQKGKNTDIKYLDGRYAKYSKADGAIGYVMKYMFKDDKNRPENCEDVFSLYSRRPGLAGKYRDEMQQQMQSDTRQMLMCVTDPWTGKQYKSFVFSYFKRKYFPTISVVMSKQIRDTFYGYIADYNYLTLLRKTMLHLDPDVRLRDYNQFETIDHDIMQKYDFLPHVLIDFPYDCPDVTRILRKCEYNSNLLYVMMRTTFADMSAKYTILKNFPWDAFEWCEQMRMNEEHSNYVCLNFGNLPKPNPSAQADKLKEHKFRAELRETF